MSLVPREGQVIRNQGYEFTVTDVRVQVDKLTGGKWVRYIGHCTQNAINKGIAETPYNGAEYGHKVGYRTY